MTRKKQIQNIIVKILVLKVDTRNEIFQFFTFCSVLKIQKRFFEIIILLTNVFGDIRRSVELPKKISDSMQRNCGQQVHFGSIRWTDLLKKKNAVK